MCVDLLEPEDVSVCFACMVKPQKHAPIDCEGLRQRARNYDSTVILFNIC